MTQDQIDHGKDSAGGLSALIRDLVDAHMFESPTPDVVLDVLVAAQRDGLIPSGATIDRDAAERISALMGEQ